MRITTTVDYAVRGILYLAVQANGRRVLLNEIAEFEGVPKPFLGKIFQTLVKANLLLSFKGTNGGFVLSRPQAEINLRMVVEAVDGPIFLSRCLMRRGECTKDNSCPVHPVWREAQAKLVGILERCTIEDLAGRISPEFFHRRTGGALFVDG